MSNNLKASGYVQKVVYNGNIEYRNFSPDLVGLQLTSDGGTPLFTMGNFSITTNMDPKLNKTFITNPFSEFYSLDNLNLDVAQTEKLLVKNTATILNLDKTKIKNYALFGSFSEYVRVSLEEIIMKWPASLYAILGYTNEFGTVINGQTVEDYTYDIINNVSTFKVSNNLLNNKFGINYLANGTIIDTFNETNDLRNLTINYLSYAILFNEIEYPVLGFTGSTFLTDDYLYFETRGPIFSGQLTNVSYHIKPNKTFEDTFYNELNDFEGYLLNRMVLPKYTAIFNFPLKSDNGVLLHVEKSVTWPVLDGYNIEFESPEYVAYATDLLEIANNSDLTETNLMVRFLVAESITSFDTLPVHLDELHMDTSGQKVTKTLSLYGREYDDLNKYIQGISFAHVVSYDKQDNTPDKYLKDLARVLGWDLISSVVENDLLSNYVTTGNAKFSGQTVGLTPVEADIELWRRLILNSPWIWKSKGARKSIEFLLKFIGTPKGLIEFNEYVYKVDEPIDMEIFIRALELNGLDTDTSLYPVDDDGYPRFFADTVDMYFQNNGLWYRQTGGSGSTVDVLAGNNPHVGPYDGGFKYLNQLTTLIPDFSAITVTSQTVTTGSTNLFVNLNQGRITDYSGETFVEITNEDGSNLPSCIIATSSIIQDPLKSDFIDDCGCETGLSDDSLSVFIKKIDSSNTVVTLPTQKSPCEDVKSFTVGTNSEFVFSVYQYNKDGSKFQINGNDAVIDTKYVAIECCRANGGHSTYHDEFVKISDTENILERGYVCCDGNNLEKCLQWATCNWVISPTIVSTPIDGVDTKMLLFTSLYGSADPANGAVNGIRTFLVPTESLCPVGWTVPILMKDPFTLLTGTGCKLTPYGISNYTSLAQLYITKAEAGNCGYSFPIPPAPDYTPTIKYRVQGLTEYRYKDGSNATWIFGDHSDAKIKCVAKNPFGVVGTDIPTSPSNPVIQGGGRLPDVWSVFPIGEGVQFYVNNNKNATKLNYNGKWWMVITAAEIADGYGTGLPIGEYIITFADGVVTRVVNVTNLPSNCAIY